MGTVKRTYDTRVSEIIARTGNADLFPEFDIPRSTRDSWVRRGPRPVIGLDDDIEEQARLRDRIAKLERSVRVLTTLLRLALTMLRLSGFRIDTARMPEGAQKQALLFAITKALATLLLASVLKVRHLSASRFHVTGRAIGS